jgi:hypothetical protein
MARKILKLEEECTPYVSIVFVNPFQFVKYFLKTKLEKD